MTHIIILYLHVTLLIHSFIYLYILFMHSFNYCREEVSSKIIGWVLITYFKSSHQRFFMKKAVLKNLVIFTGKQLCWSLFLIKLLAFRLLFCENCKNLKNIYFKKHLRTATFAPCEINF